MGVERKSKKQPHLSPIVPVGGSPPVFSLSLSFFPFVTMSFWASFYVTEATLNGLVSRGLLCPLTNGERSPAPPLGYIISFMHFHERGFRRPPPSSFRGCCSTMG